MKGKWYLLGAGCFLVGVSAMNDRSWGVVATVSAALYMFLAGVLFERYPKTSQAHFTGFTTEPDIKVGDGRGFAPKNLPTHHHSLRHEIHLREIAEMTNPVQEIGEALEGVGFNKAKDIFWWDDWTSGNRVFTQEVK